MNQRVGSTELRCVIAGRLFSLLIPFVHGSNEANAWREEIVFAGPMDGPIVAAVARLEREHAVQAVWVTQLRSGQANYLTCDLQALLQGRRARAMRARKEAKRRWSA